MITRWRYDDGRPKYLDSLGNLSRGGKPTWYCIWERAPDEADTEYDVTEWFECQQTQPNDHRFWIWRPSHGTIQITITDQTLATAFQLRFGHAAD